MVLILISDGNREDMYLQRYPEIVEKREFAEGDIRTLYTARFDGFDEFEAFLNDITKNWTVKIWCPEYANTSLHSRARNGRLSWRYATSTSKLIRTTGCRSNDYGQGGYI